MARQAEAERERRAKVIAAEGEYQAAERLSEAAALLGREKDAIALRTLQTLAEVATEQNSTLIFPVPADLITVLRWGSATGSPASRQSLNHPGHSQHRSRRWAN
jgi:hypothetical protein